SALELDGTGGDIDGIVDKSERAALLIGGVGILRARADGEAAQCHVLFDGGQLGFGNGESDVDGLNLVDGDHVHIVGGDHVTLFDGEVAGAPVDGRIDGGVAELDLGVFSGGGAGANGGLGASDGGLVGIDGLCAGIGAGAQLLRLVFGDDAGGKE